MLVSRVSQVNNTGIVPTRVSTKRTDFANPNFGAVPPSVQNELKFVTDRFPGLGEYGSRLMLDLEGVMVPSPKGGLESALESLGDVGSKIRDTVTNGIVAIGEHVIKATQDSNMPPTLRRMHMHIEEDTRPATDSLHGAEHIVESFSRAA